MLHFSRLQKISQMIILYKRYLNYSSVLQSNLIKLKNNSVRKRSKYRFTKIILHIVEEFQVTDHFKIHLN